MACDRHAGTRLAGCAPADRPVGYRHTNAIPLGGVGGRDRRGNRRRVLRFVHGRPARIRGAVEQHVDRRAPDHGPAVDRPALDRTRAQQPGGPHPRRGAYLGRGRRGRHRGRRGRRPGRGPGGRHLATRTGSIGNGTPASCTSAAVVEAVAAGGIITFDCGPDPVTITMTATAKVRNDNGPRDRARRRRHGDAQRRRPAPDPLHEHLRRGPGLDHLALPGPGPPAADRAEPDVRRRQLDRRDRSRAAAAAPSSCGAAGSRWSTRGSSDNRATRPGPTWAAPRSGC